MYAYPRRFKRLYCDFDDTFTDDCKSTVKVEEEPQSQFQVGDKVIVVTTDYNLKDVVGGMGIITEIMPHGYHIKSSTGEWFVKDKDIMPYSVFTKENPKPQFKLGDKVKVLYSPDHQGKISVVESVIRSTSDISPYCYALSGILGTFFEKCLESYTEPETKDDTKETKELNLCELFDNGDLLCSLFYSPAFGKVSFEENRASEGEIEIETKTEGVIFVLDQYGRIANEDGVCILFPSRALYEQYPLDPYTAWMKWQEEQKKFGLDIKIETYFEGKYGWEDCDDDVSCLHFRTPADRDKCIKEINTIIEKYSEK